jgi:hypothetical protein
VDIQPDDADLAQGVFDILQCFFPNDSFDFLCHEFTFFVFVEGGRDGAFRTAPLTLALITVPSAAGSWW